VCSAPSRIDLSGGAADIFEKCTLNCAVSLRAHCEVQSVSKGIEVLLGGNPVSLVDVPVIEAAICRAKAKNLNFRLSIHSEIPKASGLGGSGSMTVAIIHALTLFQNREMNLYELAEQAQRAETDVGMLNGYQDWYAAAFGGFLFLDFQGKRNNPLEEEPYATVEDLSQYIGDMKFVAAHTGVLHSSALSNDALYQNYMNGDKTVVSLIDRLDVITREAKKAVVHKNIEKISEIVKENQEIIRAFGRSAPENEKLIEAAYRGGALACKVTGAGHGGCIAAVCSGERNQQAVKNALLEETDEIYPVEVDKGVFAESKLVEALS
jgi:D-glycero-alpha-D-manno-heptose-7-phosphate kinase